MSENTKKFSRCLRSLLAVSGVNHAELACHMGVAAPVVYRWENGTSAPDIYQFQKIARFFGVPCSWFLDSENNLPNVPELAAWLGLSEDTVDSLLVLAEGKSRDVLDALDDAVYALVSVVTAAREDTE